MAWYKYAHRENKYHAKSTEYGGRYYASKLEASQAMELDMRMKAGELHSWKPQVPFKFYLVEEKKKWYLTDQPPNGRHNIFLCTYILDFIAERRDGTIEFIETKGMELSAWKTKWKYLEALYGEDPMIVLRVVK